MIKVNLFMSLYYCIYMYIEQYQYICSACMQQDMYKNKNCIF